MMMNGFFQKIMYSKQSATSDSNANSINKIDAPNEILMTTSALRGIQSKVHVDDDGEMEEVIGHIKVKRLKKRKLVKVPPFGTLGLNINVVPSLGMGVNAVSPTSCLKGTISRGDIICEFGGEDLRHASLNAFIELIKIGEQDKEEYRHIIVEYKAADVQKLWLHVEEENGKEFVIQLFIFFIITIFYGKKFWKQIFGNLELFQYQ
jgi:hypothetical protein